MPRSHVHLAIISSGLVSQLALASAIPSSITGKFDFEAAIQRVVDAMTPLAADAGYTNIEVEQAWTDDLLQAGARVTEDAPKTIQLLVNGGLARAKHQSYDGFLLALCHEVGHVLGGSPKNLKRDRRFRTTPGNFYPDGTWEGQADYFASLRCMRTVLRDDDNLAIVKRATDAGKVPAELTQECARVWGAGTQGQAVCIRTALAAEDLLRAMHGAKVDHFQAQGEPYDEEAASLNARAPRPTNDEGYPGGGHPSLQCRLDILRAGALCPIHPPEMPRDIDPNAGACPSYGVGGRPTCFIPPTHKSVWFALSSKEDARWNGVVHLAARGDGTRIESGCSGTLLDTGKGGDGAPAYVLSAGHCFATLPKGRVVSDQPTEQVAVLNAFADVDKTFDGRNGSLPDPTDARESRWSIPIEKVAVASVDKRDRGLYQLPISVGELRSRGFNLYKISPEQPLENAAVYTAGVPLENMPTSLTRLTGQSCEVRNNVDLREGPYQWKAALKTDCSIVGGWSGAALFDESQRIVGVLNTRVDPSPGTPCSLDHPCETQDGEEKLDMLNSAYAMPVADLNACFNSSGRFAPDQRGCTLTGPN